MKRFLAVGFLVVLAAVTVATWTGNAEAGRYKTIPAKWSTGADTTFIEDENDTLRTAPIDLSDWDFGLGGTTTAQQYASIAFVVTGASDGNADSVYYSIEKSWDGVNWTQGALSAAAGACAVPAGGMGAVAPMTFVGHLILDWDGTVALSLQPLPRLFRLKVAGDQGGTTPALSGVKCFITYPTLFDY